MTACSTCTTPLTCKWKRGCIAPKAVSRPRVSKRISKQVVAQYNLSVCQAHAHQGGKWYDALDTFPAALVDANGVVIIEKKQDYDALFASGGPGRVIQRKPPRPPCIGFRAGISQLHGYTPFSLLPTKVKHMDTQTVKRDKRNQKEYTSAHRRLRKQFVHGFASLEAIQAELLAVQDDYNFEPGAVEELWLRIVCDSVVAGFVEFIVASRTSISTLDEVLTEWDTVSSIVGNQQATYGELFALYCFVDAERNHMPRRSLLNIVRHTPKLTAAYANQYGKITSLWRLYVAQEHPDYARMMDELSAFDSNFERRFGQIATPFALVEQMLNKVPGLRNAVMLDPACGRGTFLLTALTKHGTPVSRLFGVDIDAGKVYITAAFLKPYSDTTATVFVGDALTILTDGNTPMPKFDAVVGNPPYNSPPLPGGQSLDLYPAFIDLAVDLADTVAFITPKRWFSKNSSGNKELRQRMTTEYGLREITTIDSKEQFGIKIEGGVAYYIMTKGYQGPVAVDGKDYDLANINSQYGMIILDHDARVDVALALIKKHGGVLDNFHGQPAFGIRSNHKQIEPTATSIPCLFSQRRGGIKHIDPAGVTNLHLKDTYKVVFQAANGAAGPRLKKTDAFVLDPGSIMADSHVFFDFATQAERDEFFAYITSDVVLDMIAVCKVKQHITSHVFRFVPNIRDLSLFDVPVAGEAS